MKRLRTVLLGLSVMATTVIGLAVPASAATIVVGPGESIQAAVDAAQPGDTILVEPGTYRESVEIRKDDLTIIGAGATNDGSTTILEPPAQPPNDRCFDETENVRDGFCILGPPPDEPFEPGGPVTIDTRIEGFLIRNFSGSGIFVSNARYTTLRENAVVNNGEYGIFSLESQGTRIVESFSTGHDEAGFYIGDVRNSAGGILDSSATGERHGVFIRDASQGRIEGNTFRDNCVGIVLLDTSLPNPVSRWVIRNNIASHNQEACPGGDEGPPLSGAGIGLIGVRETTVEGNRTNNNRATGPSVLSGGIVLRAASDVGGPAPINNLIRNNVAHRNRPYDIFWDGSGSSNRFVNNDCDRSSPPGICD